MLDLTEVLRAALTLLTAAATALLGAYIRGSATESGRRRVSALVNIAVEAAEQLYSASGMGGEKKRYVLDWLRSRGVTLDGDELDGMIEAAVYRLRQAADIV